MPATNRISGATYEHVGSGSEFMDGLALCGSVDKFRKLSPLPEDAQRIVDEAVIRVGRQNLVIVNDLISEGLTRPLPNWLSVLEIKQDKVGEGGNAQRTMEIDVRGERFVMDRIGYTVPIYATHQDFSFGGRELAAAARVGAPLDTSHVEQSTRNVNLAIEDQAINGLTDANGDNILINGNTTPGLLTSPVNTFTYTGTNKAWDHASKSGQEILNDLLGMIAVAQADKKYGPFNLYIPTAYGNAVNKNFSDGVTTFDKSIRQRLEEVEAGGRNVRIRVADLLPANRTVLLQPTSDVIDVIVGQTPATLSWMANNGLGRRYFLVLSCVITRIKTDYNGGSGIVVGNVT